MEDADVQEVLPLTEEILATAGCRLTEKKVFFKEETPERPLIFWQISLQSDIYWWQ